MAVLFAWPPAPMSSSAGSAVTAAALTAATPPPPPIIPAGLIIPGAEIIMEADLEGTTTGTPNLTIGFYIGSVGGAIGSATLIAATAANAMTASWSAWPVKLRYRGTFRTLSASAGVIQGTGELLYPTSLTAWTSSPFPTTAAARTVSTLNTQQNNQLDVGVTLSTTTGSPSVTCTGFSCMILG